MYPLMAEPSTLIFVGSANTGRTSAAARLEASASRDRR